MALPVKIASCFGVLESMKSQTPSTKLQTNLKFQYPMTRTCLELSSVKMMEKFGISNFGHCDLEFLVTFASAALQRLMKPPS